LEFGRPCSLKLQKGHCQSTSTHQKESQKNRFKEKQRKNMRPDRGSTDNESRSVSAAIGRGIAKLEAVLDKWVRSTGYELGFVVVRGSFFSLL